jgi:predicted amidophosphoribosyltransferase
VLRQRQRGFVYAWPLAPLIQHYKYAGNLALAPLLARALGETLTASADVIIPCRSPPGACASAASISRLKLRVY